MSFVFGVFKVSFAAYSLLSGYNSICFFLLFAFLVYTLGSHPNTRLRQASESFSPGDVSQ
jgi:membrane protein DedA with SNARE-associated domain